MNLKLFETREKLKCTLDCMMFAKNKEELEVLFGNAIDDFLAYHKELKNRY